MPNPHGSDLLTEAEAAHVLALAPSTLTGWRHIAYTTGRNPGPRFVQLGRATLQPGALLLGQALDVLARQRSPVAHGHRDEPRRRLLDLEAALACFALDLRADLLLSALHFGERLLAASLELLALERARDLLARVRE